jgi:hypothetical protein
MKKYIFTLLLALLLVSSASASTNWAIDGRPTSDWFSANDSFRNIPLQWMREADDLIALGSNPGIGNIYYVDTNVANTGDGSNWNNALDTLDAAFALCSGSNGDIVLVAQNSSETGVVGTANIWDADVAGVTVIGLGKGRDSPSYTFKFTSNTCSIGANDVHIHNLRFRPGVSAIVAAVTIDTNVLGPMLTNCVWEEPATTSFDFLDGIDVGSGVDDLSVVDCQYYNTSVTGPAHFIEAGNGVNERMRILDNEIFGNFSVSAIWSDTVDENVLIAGNTIFQKTSAQHAVEFTAAATGILRNNFIYAPATATSIDAGAMISLENYVGTAVDYSGVLWPAQN